MSAPIQQRVMLHSKVDADGCWTWTRALSHNGYGFITINTRQRRAARVSYEVFRGPIPAGFQIDHLCRNRACVNPQHLEAVTQQENIRRSDGIQATNARKTHCKRGHEFTADNTIRQGPNGKDRRCRTCRDVYMREWKARQ